MCWWLTVAGMVGRGKWRWLCYGALDWVRLAVDGRQGAHRPPAAATQSALQRRARSAYGTRELNLSPSFCPYTQVLTLRLVAKLVMLLEAQGQVKSILTSLAAGRLAISICRLLSTRWCGKGTLEWLEPNVQARARVYYLQRVQRFLSFLFKTYRQVAYNYILMLLISFIIIYI